MNILLLSGPTSPNSGRNPLYKGTDRAHPTYCDRFSDEHEINQYFFWFLEEGGESGVVHDLPRAKRYAELLNLHVKGTPFEVIEVDDGESRSTCSGEFLGFDLSCSYNSSLLQWGFTSFSGLNTLPEHIRELCELLNRYYKLHLNRFGLFDDYEIASSCRRSMIALQTLSPNLYEGGDLNKFDVVSVCLVKIHESQPN